MIEEESLTPEMRLARDKVHAALSDPAISPSRAWHDVDHPECNDPECEWVPPEGEWLLSEWVTILAFTSAVDGKTWYTRLPSQNMPIHHRLGLLEMGMNGFDD